MLKNTSTTSKLLLLILLFSGLVLFIGTFGIREIRTMKDNSDKMYEDVVYPIGQLTSVRFAYIHSIRNTLNQLKNKELSFEESIKQLNQTEKIINKHWTAYLLTKHSIQEEKLINVTQKSINESRLKAETLKIILKLKDENALNDFALKNFFASLTNTTGKLTTLIEYQENQANQYKNINSKVFKNSKKNLLYILIITTLIVFVFGYLIIRDIKSLITSLKTTNENLILNEVKYRSVFENAGDGLFLVGSDKLIKEVNTVASSLTGYSFDELIKMTPNDLHSPEDLVQNPFDWERLSKEKSVIQQRKMLKKDGSIIDIEINSTLISENQILSVVRDITERIKLEKTQISSDQKYGIAVKNSLDTIIITNYPSGEFVEVNPKFTELFGYTSKETIGKKSIDLNLHFDLKTREEIYTEIESVGFTKNKEVDFVTKNGNQVICIVTSNLFYIENDAFLYTVIKDITEQKKSEKEIENLDKKITQLIASTEAVIWEADTETFTMSYVNQYAETMFGYKVEEWYAKNFWADHIYFEDREEAVSYCVDQTKVHARHSFDYRFLKSDGELIWVRDIVNVIIEEGKPKWLRGIMIDITASKNAENELNVSNARLRLATESANIGVFDVDYIEKEIICDDLCYTIFGLKRSDEPNPYNAVFKAFHPDDLEIIKVNGPFSSNESTEYNATYRIIHPTGIIRVIETSSVITRDFNGKALRMTGVHRDITETMEADKKIKDISTRLQLATTSTNIGIFDWDLNNGDLLWDETIYKIHGIAQENCADNKKALVKVTHPEDRENAIAFIVESIKNANDFNYVYRIILPSKEIRYIESNSIILRNEATGRATRMIGVNKDITDLIKTQEQLQNMNKVLEEKVAIRTEDLELANKKINDSINYAQNIQLAILSKSEDCYSIFPESFVLWKPKDVVSGDFLWSYSSDDYKYIAAIDCTGHGVPGALLSLVAKQILDKIVISDEVENPQEILSQLDKQIIDTLNQAKSIVKDGLDIALCRIDLKNNLLAFAGAQRPLFYYNGKEITEINGSKFGIGGLLGLNAKKSFNQTELNFKPGDLIYLTSDGYYSQFGGEKGKKMMKRRFIRYLDEISKQPIKNQEKQLNQRLNVWQGSEEQVDDILVIGIKL